MTQKSIQWLCKASRRRSFLNNVLALVKLVLSRRTLLLWASVLLCKSWMVIIFTSIRAILVLRLTTMKNWKLKALLSGHWRKTTRSLWSTMMPKLIPITTLYRCTKSILRLVQGNWNNHQDIRIDQFFDSIILSWKTVLFPKSNGKNYCNFSSSISRKVSSE